MFKLQCVEGNIQPPHLDLKDKKTTKNKGCSYNERMIFFFIFFPFVFLSSYDFFKCLSYIYPRTYWPGICFSFPFPFPFPCRLFSTPQGPFLP